MSGNNNKRKQFRKSKSQGSTNILKNVHVVRAIMKERCIVVCIEPRELKNVHTYIFLYNIYTCISYDIS